MAITLQTDSNGFLQVTPNPPTGTGSAQAQGTTAPGIALVGNPLTIASLADGANAASATVQALVADNAKNVKVNTEGGKATYSSAFTVTPAASATDIAQLIGSATKVVHVTRIQVSGIATTAVNIDVLAIKRSAADSAGTIVAQTVVNHDVNDGAATGVCSAITVNPTLGGTGAKYGTVRFGKLFLGASTSLANQLVWDFTNRNEKGIILRGVADALVVNLNGVQSTGQVMDVEYTWTED